MAFWNFGKKDKEKKQPEPALEPPVEYDADIDANLKHELQENEQEIVEELRASPTPAHTPLDDAKEAEDLRDHSNEGGWLSRLAEGLAKSTNKLTQGIVDVFTKSKLDDDTLENLEDLLITADLGPRTAAKIVKAFGERKFDDGVSPEKVREALAEEIEKILIPVAKPLEISKPTNGPFTILVTGVNGVGKTTTIGKLGKWMQARHHKVVFAAADTFRAAAVEQIQIWGQRLHVPVIAKDVGADAAAVAFEAFEKAKTDGADVLIIDTAGRLHNKSGLMDELGKIVRVLGKHDAGAPQATLLVLDATTGQNAYAQVEGFKDVANITGLVVTKLDGSAKGGVVVGLADKFGLPIHAVGVGEGLDDLQPFTARDFARSLVGL